MSNFKSMKFEINGRELTVKEGHQRLVIESEDGQSVLMVWVSPEGGTFIEHFTNNYGDSDNPSTETEMNFDTGKILTRED